MVNRESYTIFVHKIRISGDHPIRTFFYDWDEFLEETVGMYVHLTEHDFKKQGFATHAKDNK